MQSTPQKVDEQPTPTRSREELESIIAHVYQNNPIMDNIIRNISCLETRKNFERAAYRCQQLSNRISRIFIPKHFEELKIYSYHNLQYVRSMTEIRLGSLCGEVSTRYSFLDTYKDEMNRKIMNLLNNAITKYSNHIDDVSVGVGFTSYNIGQISDEIRVDKELLEYFCSLTNLKKMAFSRCTFTREAADFLASDECDFTKKLQCVKIHSLEYPHGSMRDMAKIVGENVKELHMESLRDSEFQAGLAERVESLNLVFKKASLEICDNIEVAHMRRVIKVFQNRSERLQLTFCNVYETPEGPSNIWDIARNCKDYDNLTGLTLSLDCKDDGVRTTECITTIQSLHYIENLEQLSITLHQPERLIDDLIDEMSQIYLLRSLQINAIDQYEDRDKMFDLLFKLPDTIEELQFTNISISEEIIHILVEKLGKNLKVLKIKDGQVLDIYTVFEKIMNGFENLEELEFNQPLPPRALIKLVIKKSIRRAHVAYNNMPAVCELSMKNNFFKVTKTNGWFCSHMLLLEGRKHSNM